MTKKREHKKRIGFTINIDGLDLKDHDDEPKIESVKLKTNAIVQYPQFYNSMIANLNCALCSTFVIILGKIHELHK